VAQLSRPYRERREIPWLEYGWVLSQFGLDRKKSKERYRGFVSKVVEDSTERDALT